jgi:hypothetical protein
MSIHGKLPRRGTPDAANLLSNFVFPECKLSLESRASWKEVFFDSMITEYDARRLYWYLESRHADVFAVLVDVLNPWLRDEIDHAHGFAIIYASFSNISFDEVLLSAELREPDFSIIDSIATDPLKLLVALAYDEIVTTHVYHRSIKIYDEFACSKLSSWIRKAKRDEAMHFFAFVEKAKQLYPHRLHEVSGMLDQIYRVDFEKESYTGTFVLDHNAPDFPISKEEIKSTILPAIIKKFVC